MNSQSLIVTFPATLEPAPLCAVWERKLQRRKVKVVKSVVITPPPSTFEELPRKVQSSKSTFGPSMKRPAPPAATAAMLPDSTEFSSKWQRRTCVVPLPYPESAPPSDSLPATEFRRKMQSSKVGEAPKLATAPPPRLRPLPARLSLKMHRRKVGDETMTSAPPPARGLSAVASPFVTVNPSMRVPAPASSR